MVGGTLNYSVKAFRLSCYGMSL